MKTLLILSALAISSVSFAQAPERGEVRIKDVTVMGSGCPAGTAAAFVAGSDDKSTTADYLHVIYDAFAAKSGKNTSTRDQRKNCNIGFNVEFPEGYRFYFKYLQFDGFAELASGTNAEFQTVIRAPFGSSVKGKALLRGPFEGEFDYEETGSVLKKFDSGCTGSALIKIENKIRIKGDTDKAGVVTIDSGSGEGYQGLELAWEKC